MNQMSALPEVTPAGFYVLVALAAGEAHGYGVMRFVESLTGGAVKLPAGTLYRTMARLVANELVEESDENDPQAPHDARRRYYRLTRLGRQVARQETGLLMSVMAAADSAGLTVPEESP
jgi:DNA-binding PadR family transcriptional regulator